MTTDPTVARLRFFAPALSRMRRHAEIMTGITVPSGAAADDLLAGFHADMRAITDRLTHWLAQASRDSNSNP